MQKELAVGTLVNMAFDDAIAELRHGLLARTRLRGGRAERVLEARRLLAAAERRGEGAGLGGVLVRQRRHRRLAAGSGELQRWQWLWFRRVQDPMSKRCRVLFDQL